jgi:hypothetical protein
VLFCCEPTLTRNKTGTLHVSHLLMSGFYFRTRQLLSYSGRLRPSVRATKAQRGSRGIPLLFSLGTGWGLVVNATPRPLYPRESPGTHCTGGWVGPRAGLDGCRKSRPPLGFDTRTVQPVASRYNDCATRPRTCRQETEMVPEVSEATAYHLGFSSY